MNEPTPRSNPKLNQEWRDFYSTALNPSSGTAGTSPQLYRRSMQPALFPTKNAHAGSTFTKDYDGLRCWSTNANTVLLSNDLAEFHELCHSLKAHSVGILAIQEVNQNLLDRNIYNQLEDALKLHFGACVLVSSSTPIRSPTSWKPGGTILAVLGTWSHTVTATSSDSLGRWCKATLSGRDGSLLSVYSLYNVVKTDISKVGPATIFAQQWQLLRLSGHEKPDPRQQCIDDLKIEVQKEQNIGSEIVIMGDLNEVVGDDPALMASVCATCHLYDPFSDLYPDQADTPTYARGRKRLDWVFVSRSLSPTIDAVGYNRYNLLYHSDHRAIFLDLAKRDSLGLSSPLVPHSRRPIHSNSPHVRDFVLETYKHLQENKVFHKFSDFNLDAATDDDPSKTANAIDRQLTKALLHAQQKCSRPQTHPWSETLHLASLRLRYWKTAQSSRRNHFDATPELALICETTGPMPPIPQDTRLLLNHVRIAQAHLRIKRRQAKAARQDFLQDLKERIATRKTSNSLPLPQALKMIDKQLESTQRFRRIQRALGNNTSQPLTQVEVTTTEEHLDPATGERDHRTHTEVINVRAALEQAILSRNKRHFAQAKDTPWAQPPFSLISSANDFNLYHDTEGNEIHLPPECFVETSTVLDILREEANKSHPKWSEQLNFDTFLSGLLKWNERTSTSPSGRHLGLYKSLVTAHIDSGGDFRADLPDDDEDTSIQDMATLILQVIHGLASLSCLHGFYLDRWSIVVNVMIYKKPGVLELDKLRVIHLFEADFNLIVGLLFGRRAMHHSVDNHLLHTGQYGRPGGECQDAAFAKILHNHMAHYSKTPLGQFESDAASCFDRIVMAFCFAVLSVWGAPTPALRMWEQTLYSIVHSVKTALGLSKDTYSYSTTSPIIGPGQGSMGGPAACSTITSPLLTAMDRLAHGLTFTSPDQQVHYETRAKMFIDDNSNYSNDFHRWLACPPTPEALRDMIQHDAQTWERLLWTSGGLLKLEKCLYYLTYWTFDADGTASLVPSSDLPPMHLSSGNSGSITSINQHDSTQSHRTLGNWLSANLQMNTALGKLQTRAGSYTRSIAVGYMTPYDAWISYFACFLPSMTYTFPVSHHTPAQLDKLQAAPKRATLLKLGYRRNLPDAVVYGSIHYGGIGLRPLFIEAGIAQYLIFTRHLRAQTDIGSLLRITLHWWQLQAGVSYSLLEFPDPVLQYLPWDWFSCFRNFLRIISGSLHVRYITSHLPVPPRANDQCLMDIIAAVPGVTPQHQGIFNTVRLFLGIVFLSEISTADGRHLSRDAWQGSRPRHTPLLWPYQAAPNQQSFQVWRRLLATAFLADHRPRVEFRTHDLTLACPLGQWSSSSAWLRNKWSSFFSPTTQLLYISKDSSYECHRRKRNSRARNRLFLPDPSTSVCSLPSDSAPVDLARQPRFLVASQHQPIVTATPRPTFLTFEDYTQSLPGWDRFLIENVHLLDLDHLLEQIENMKQLVFCSDGGAVSTVGSYGSIIATDDTILTETRGQAYGHTPRSFRAEGYGLLANLRLVYHLLSFFELPLTLPPLTIVSDNAGLLQRISAALSTKYVRPRKFLSSEIDIEMQIIDTLHLLDTDVSFSHVKGHQDDSIDPTELPWHAQLNIRCDAIATETLTTVEHETTVPFLPASEVSLSIADTTLTHHVPSQIRRLHASQQQRIYLCKHHSWVLPSLFDTVHWDVVRPALLAFSFAKKKRLTEWINKILPLQVQQFRFQQSSSSRCPSQCGADETYHHFLRCPHPARTVHLMTLQSDLKVLAASHRLDPSLARILFSFLCQYTGEEPLPPPTKPNHLRLFQTQLALGPDSLLFGFFHDQWVPLQHEYLGLRKLPRSKNQAFLCIRSLVITIFDSWFHLWLLRNSHLHGTSANNLHSYRRLQLLREIRDLYDSAPSMLRHDRDIFRHDYESFLEVPERALLSFVKFAKPVVKRSQKQAAKLGPNCRAITDYFNYVAPEIPPHVVAAILGTSGRCQPDPSQQEPD
jgi:hypothetical protein